GVVARGRDAPRPHFDGAGTLEGHDGLLAPPLGTRLAHGNARHVVVELGNVHGPQRRKGAPVDRLGKGDLQRVPLLIQLNHPHPPPPSPPPRPRGLAKGPRSRTRPRPPGSGRPPAPPPPRAPAGRSPRPRSAPPRGAPGASGASSPPGDRPPPPPPRPGAGSAT